MWTWYLSRPGLSPSRTNWVSNSIWSRATSRSQLGDDAATTIAEAAIQDDLDVGLLAKLLAQVLVHIWKLPGDDEKEPGHAALRERGRRSRGNGQATPDQPRGSIDRPRERHRRHFSHGFPVLPIRRDRRDDDTSLDGDEVDADERDAHPGVDDDALVEHAIQNVDEAAPGSRSLNSHRR